MLRNIFFRNFSSKVSKFQVFPSETRVKTRSLVESVAESKDQQAFYAWHPKKAIPYELTRPLPKASEQNTVTLMREEKLEEALKAHKHEYPDKVRRELSQLTFTTKHRWFPRARDRKAKKTEMDRTYL